ncbi:MAG: sulfotransferase, partial [Actinomycetota bacterium]
PPPEPDAPDDARVEAAADELGFPQAVAEGLRAIHTYSAHMAKECLSAQAFSFRTEEFVSRYALPGYTSWLQSCDMTPAYRMHRRVLQVLQLRMPPRRWVLKSPVHLQALPELAATYPDARFVFTHRDPTPVLASVSSLVATLRSAFSDQVDPIAIGRYHLELYGNSLDRLVDHVDGLLASSPVAHVRHEDLLTDPAATVERVYEELGIDRSAAAGAALDDEIGAGRDREDRAGAHRYDLADFGLSPADTTEPFRRYRRRFLEAA